MSLSLEVHARRTSFTIEGKTLSIGSTTRRTTIVDVGRMGPQGPPGLPGAAAASYTHEQASASSTWTIAHNLGWRPTITVFSTGGLEVLADVVHLSTDVAQVLFVEPMAGSARCT